MPEMLVHISNIMPGKKFNPAMHAYVREGVNRSGGSATVLIHPFYCESYLPKIDDLFENYILCKRITSLDYSSYISRLEGFLKRSDRPVFLLSQEMDVKKLGKWMLRLNIPAPVIIVKTEYHSPAPIFDGQEASRVIKNQFDTNEAFKPFVSLLKDVGVSRGFLAGEYHYTENSVPYGCVPATLTALSPFLSVEMIDGLTFPNLDVPKVSDK